VRRTRNAPGSVGIGVVSDVIIVIVGAKAGHIDRPGSLEGGAQTRGIRAISLPREGLHDARGQRDGELAAVQAGGVRRKLAQRVRRVSAAAAARTPT